jgi:hypothetical protein
MPNIGEYCSQNYTPNYGYKRNETNITSNYEQNLATYYMLQGMCSNNYIQNQNNPQSRELSRTSVIKAPSQFTYSGLF